MKGFGIGSRQRVWPGVALIALAALGGCEDREDRRRDADLQLQGNRIERLMAENRVLQESLLEARKDIEALKREALRSISISEKSPAPEQPVPVPPPEIAPPAAAPTPSETPPARCPGEIRLRVFPDSETVPAFLETRANYGGPERLQFVRGTESGEYTVFFSGEPGDGDALAEALTSRGELSILTEFAGGLEHFEVDDRFREQFGLLFPAANDALQWVTDEKGKVAVKSADRTAIIALGKQVSHKDPTLHILPVPGGTKGIWSSRVAHRMPLHSSASLEKVRVTEDEGAATLFLGLAEQQGEAFRGPVPAGDTWFILLDGNWIETAKLPGKQAGPIHSVELTFRELPKRLRPAEARRVARILTTPVPTRDIRIEVERIAEGCPR